MLFCIEIFLFYIYFTNVISFCISFYSFFFFNSIQRRIRQFGEALFVQFKNLNLSRQEKLEPVFSSTTKYSGMSGRIQWNKNPVPMKIGEPNQQQSIKILGLERTSIYKQKSFTDENRRTKSTTIN